jgi:hypothetical protein
LLAFTSESFVFSPAVSKGEDQNTENVAFPVVVYGYETCLTLKEEHRLRVFENRMPRRILLPERTGITRC